MLAESCKNCDSTDWNIEPQGVGALLVCSGCGVDKQSVVPVHINPKKMLDKGYLIKDGNTYVPYHAVEAYAEILSQPQSGPSEDMKALADIGKEFERQLPSAMFSNYGYPDSWDKRSWAVYQKPEDWRRIIPLLKGKAAKPAPETTAP